MNKNKQLAINLAAQLISFGVNFVISFFLTPFVVENVGREAYGFVELANNFISYATIITLALNSMAGRFITISIHQERYEDTNKYFTSVLFSNIVMAVPLTVAGAVILLFLDKIVSVPANILGDVTVLWGLLFLNFALSLIGNVFSIATFSQNRLELSSIRTIESHLIKAGILLAAYFFFRPYVWYLGLATLASGIFLILSNMYYTKKLTPFVKIKKEYFDFSKVKELVASGVWNSVTKISGTLSTGLDLLVTNLFVGAAAMGTVSISKTLPTYVLSVFGTLSNVFMPQLTISYAKDDSEDIKAQINSAMRILSFFACIPAVFLYAFGTEFYSLWMPEQDAKLLNMLTILTTLTFPSTLPLEPLWNIFTVTNKVKQSSLFLIITSFLTIGIVFVLLGIAPNENIKMYIIVGVSTVVGIIRNFTFLPMYGAKCLKFKWYTFFPVIFKNIFVVGVTTALAFSIKLVIHINSWFTLILATGVMCVMACVINYFLMLGKNERKKLLDIVLRRIKK